MNDNNHWVIRNVRLSQVVPLIVATASIGFANPAIAAGTAAGTTISNTATATYNDPSGAPQTVNSNQVDLRVDELLDVTVVSADSGDIVTIPGSTGQILSYTVTNTGNGSEAFRLTPNGTLGGDQFDPTTTSVVLDSNGNNTYDAGLDTVYTAGSNDPTLAPDGAIKIFVLSTIPAGTTDGDRGQVNLSAAAVTGTGAPGTSFAGLGQGGGAAVVGTTGADGVDDGFYVVQSATVTFTKSQSVVDPFGGAKALPGSIVTYTLIASISGSGTLTNLVVGDPVPANTTYQAGSITLQGGGLSDVADSDVGEFTGAAVRVALGSVTGGQTRTVTFRVRVN